MNLVIATSVITVAIFVWYVRNTRPDRPNKMHVIYRNEPDDEADDIYIVA